MSSDPTNHHTDQEFQEQAIRHAALLTLCQGLLVENQRLRMKALWLELMEPLSKDSLWGA